MGEVYQARGTKLDRDVALKVLPPAFVSDPDRFARFRGSSHRLSCGFASARPWTHRWLCEYSGPLWRLRLMVV